MSDSPLDWTEVVFAGDLPLCEACEESYCDKCDLHYADCDCIGPTECESDVEYEEVGGILYARRKTETCYSDGPKY